MNACLHGLTVMTIRLANVSPFIAFGACKAASAADLWPANDTANLRHAARQRYFLEHMQ